MRTRQIPRAEWFNFFEGFNKRHPHWLTTVWLLHPRHGAQVQARDLPFEGIVSDPLETSITVQLGRTPGRNVEHPINLPIQIWLETTDEGVEAALGIESEDESTTILEFPPKALFEAHDALAKIEPAVAVEPVGPARVGGPDEFSP
jgi:hypothetical protein